MSIHTTSSGMIVKYSKYIHTLKHSLPIKLKMSKRRLASERLGSCQPLLMELVLFNFFDDLLWFKVFFIFNFCILRDLYFNFHSCAWALQQQTLYSVSSYSLFSQFSSKGDCCRYIHKSQRCYMFSFSYLGSSAFLQQYD